MLICNTRCLLENVSWVYFANFLHFRLFFQNHKIDYLRTSLLSQILKFFYSNAIKKIKKIESYLNTKHLQGNHVKRRALSCFDHQISDIKLLMLNRDRNNHQNFLQRVLDFLPLVLSRIN